MLTQSVEIPGSGTACTHDIRNLFPANEAENVRCNDLLCLSIVPLCLLNGSQLYSVRIFKALSCQQAMNLIESSELSKSLNPAWSMYKCLHRLIISFLVNTMGRNQKHQFCLLNLNHHK